MRLSLIPIPLAFAASAIAAPASFAPRQQMIQPKVFIISMFTREAEVWYKKDSAIDLMAQNITVPGFSPLFPDAHCTADGGICQLVTGESEINAATTITSLVLSTAFDLTKTYFFISGIAGVNPNVATIGGVSFARYAVQVALQDEIDAREMPDNFTSGYFPQGAQDPDEYPGHIYGTEVFEVNDALRKRAVGFAKTAVLNDSAAAIAYRAYYNQTAARTAPSVVECDVTTSDVYYSGKLLSDRFYNTTKLWTNGTGVFCASAQEDNATLEALLRGALQKKVDFSRIIVMRTLSDFDQPYANQTVINNLLHSTRGGFGPAIANIYLAGIQVVNGIVKQWDSTFERGIEPTNYIGDILGSLGGTPDFGPGKAVIEGFFEQRNSMSIMKRRNGRRFIQG